MGIMELSILFFILMSHPENSHACLDICVGSDDEKHLPTVGQQDAGWWLAHLLCSVLVIIVLVYFISIKTSSESNSCTLRDGSTSQATGSACTGSGKGTLPSKSDHKRYQEQMKAVVAATDVRGIVNSISARLKYELLEVIPKTADAELHDLMKPFLEQTTASVSWWMSVYDRCLSVVEMDKITIERWLCTYHGWRVRRYVATVSV